MNSLLALALTALLSATVIGPPAAQLPTALDALDAYDSIVLNIEAIGEASFTGVLPYSYPCIYTVTYDLPDDFCVGDQVVVYYNELVESKNNQDQWTAVVQGVYVAPNNPPLIPDKVYKPVIYLYPEEKTDVTVTLDYAGTFTHTCPTYHNGWVVTASPDGTLTDAAGSTYPYLFWEGISPTHYDMSHGFCVAGEDSESFLQDTLSFMGLEKSEIEDFLGFWLPYLEQNPYNLIAFQGASYTDTAPLEITPAPDSIVRIFLTYTPLAEPVSIPQQELSSWQRSGFSVVEWGGGVVPAS